MRPFWRRSILFLSAMRIVAIAVVAGLAVVMLSEFLTARYTQRDVSQRLEELLSAVESTAQTACFARDAVLASEVAGGLVKNSEVLRVQIISGAEILADRLKRELPDDGRQAAPPGRISRVVYSPFKPDEKVGEIILDPDAEDIRAHVRDNVSFIALLLGAQFLMVGGAVLATVLLWVVRPIKRMSDRLHLMDERSIEPLPVPKGHEATEIGRLVDDINQMGRRLLASRDEERQLRLAREIGERKYRAIFENADSGIFVVDRALRLESFNRAFARQFGLSAEVQDTSPALDLAGLRWRHPEALVALLDKCCALNASVSDDFEYAVGDDAVLWFNVALTPIGDGSVQGLVMDISRHKLAEWSAQQEAITDALSGVLNRNGFRQRLNEQIALCEGDAERGFSFILIDLDGFRRINDFMGMATGDQILLIAANRLRSCLKGSDIIARVGSDSFAVILRDTFDEKQAATVGARIVRTLKGFFEVGNTPLQLGASVGITLFPNDGPDSQTLFRNAELALDYARLGGGDRFCFFDVTMARSAEYRRLLENDLKFAVRRDELLINFQPIIDLSERRLVGAEALVRWKHPARGLVSPDSFIPLAEETGAIVDIGLWMLEAAWRAQGRDYYISINISARQIPDGLPPISLIEMVNRYGINPGSLAIEITESLFLGDFASAQTWLNAVHELGFRIYLDDFGTGYSSLSYLKRLPVDVLKVDKSFVRDMGDDNNDRTLVEAVINMANSLGLSVVAEGVENAHQMKLLEAAGCRYVQGYHFSRPVPADEFPAAEESIRALLA